MSEKKSLQVNKNPKKENGSKDKNEHVKEAYKEAEKDIEKDQKLKLNEDEDLDEGELARKEGHP